MFRTLLTIREFAKCANSRVWFLKRCGENMGPEDWTLLSPALRHRFGGRGVGSGTERVRRLVFSSLIPIVSPPRHPAPEFFGLW